MRFDIKIWRLSLWLTIFIFIFSSSGCASFRRKFIRKKKSKVEEEIIAIPQEYPQLPSDESYNNHYVYLKSWIQEMIERVDEGNGKKLKVCLEQALYQINEMKRYLREEKQAELQVYVDKLASLTSTFEDKSLTEAEVNSIRKKLEAILLNLEHKFRISKVQEWLM